MNVKPAAVKIVNVQRDAFGRATDAEMRLVSGAKGAGHTLHTCHYWPHSGTSVEKAEEIMVEVAEREGYEIVAWPWNEE